MGTCTADLADVGWTWSYAKHTVLASTTFPMGLRLLFGIWVDPNFGARTVAVVRTHMRAARELRRAQHERVWIAARDELNENGKKAFEVGFRFLVNK